MVGIVIVSHSEKLASAVQELAQQMVQGAARSAIAAGIDDPENPFGTDAMQIHQAIESVYSDDGVVVLMDLGSAILSAEMALEFLSQEQRAKVRLCEAPLVEGAIAAFVQAANGADIEQVIAEARGALAAKAAQLSGVETQPIQPVQYPQEQLTTNNQQPTTEIHLTVQNQMGLHARPAAKFVATASQFESHITLQNVSVKSQPINAKSINQIITLGIRQGHEIAIAATGTDATEALAALQQLIETQFGETSVETLQETSLPEQLAASGQLSGIAASPGIAIGSVVLYQPSVPEVGEQQVDNPQNSWQQLHTAIQTARHQIQLLRQQSSAQLGEEVAAIFDAHLLFLEDPALLDATRQQIFDYRLSAVDAWKAVVARTVRTYEALEDPYLQARSADVRDVGQRVLRLLTGVTLAPLDLKEPAILVATDLTPSETAQLDPSKVLGICTVTGGATSHSGILARSLGIPAVVGVGAELLHLENGTLIVLDGATGQVWVEPDDTQIRELQLKRDSQLAGLRTLRAVAQQPAITSDGHQIKVMANSGGVADAQIALENGAEGVGLLRSEFLYSGRMSAPTEEEQVEVYEAIANILSPHPLIIRTLDIGGDKSLPYLNLPLEANPFLGWRGIRLLLDCPDLLKTQLRAILRTTHRHQIKVMFPMIASVREIRAAKEILSTAQAELRSLGIPFDEAMEVGIMVEVPAAVAMADQLAAEVDFFSIGTNDLSQYVMAADRNNAKVATLADAFEPAVLRMIQQTVIAAHNAGIWVGVCGELASSPLATPILVGLGVDELSMNPPAIPAVKAAVVRLTISEAEAIASMMLQLDSAEAVRQYVAAW
ncbi:MAG TPA: phosphoenolpyruvate--protein phosphotransferase [Coleofasciculaceae cyanobacterium]